MIAIGMVATFQLTVRGEPSSPHANRLVTRYRENPLVVQGPGAGREVTAAGVFADLLRLTSYLGAVL